MFSVKRKAYADYERGVMSNTVADLVARVATLESNAMVQLHGSGTTNPRKFFWKAGGVAKPGALIGRRRMTECV